MAWRFKASKYKNSCPKFPKKEDWITDISTGRLLQSFGNHIKANSFYMVFNVDNLGGGALGILPLNSTGRQGPDLPLLSAHSDYVADFDFSPFDDNLLITGSHDCTVKLWQLPSSSKNLKNSLNLNSQIVCTEERKIENVLWNPVAEGILAVSSAESVRLYDVSSCKKSLSLDEHSDMVQAIAWKGDGSMLATTCKDKLIRTLDPRAQTVCQELKGHAGQKESRVSWLGSEEMLFSTGFDSVRQRQLFLWDLKNPSSPVCTHSMDTSPGVFIPFFDDRTNMLFLVGKGDNTLRFLEYTDRTPHITDVAADRTEQIKGAAVVPKQALDVMKGEINRLILLIKNAIIPTPYIVPRKSYREYHSDIFPEVPNGQPSMQASEWLAGENKPLELMDLNPSKRAPLTLRAHNLNAPGTNSITNASDSVDPSKEKKLLKCDSSAENEKKSTADLSTENNKESTINSCTENKSKPANDISENNKELTVNSTENNKESTVNSSTENSKVKGPLTPKSQRRASETIMQKIDSLNAAIELSHSPPPQRKFQKGNCVLDSKKYEEKDNDVFSDNKVAEDAKTEHSQQTRKKSCNSMEETKNSLSEEVRENKDTENENSMKNDNEATPSNSSCTENLDKNSTNSTEADGKASKIEAECNNKKDVKECLSETPKVANGAIEDKICKGKVKEETPEKSVPAKKSVSTPSRFINIRQLKFKHLKATTLNKEHHIENLKNLSRNIPGESDLFQVNQKRCAVPLSTTGGCVAIFELNKPCRLPDCGIPSLQHGTNVTDFVWDPFNNQRLVVACDDAKIRVWNIPEGGLKESVSEPEFMLIGHQEKIYFVRFHPLAKDILASASYDMTVKIWDLTTQEAVIELKGHTSQIFTLDWSPCGKKCATVCKDGKIRVYEPRVSTEPIKEGTGPSGSRGARVVWTLNGKFLVATGFDKMSQRKLFLYDAQELGAPLDLVELDSSPAILVPHYDEDSSTLFVTGRGDGTIFTFEVTHEAPHLNPLSPCRFSNLHQAISFLPKIACDVSQVEFAHAWRLLLTHIEPVSFKVPRVKSNFFQDDLFPDTKVLWEPALSGSDWLSGVDAEASRISLKPGNMESLSKAPTPSAKQKKYDSTDPEIYKTDEMKKKELIGAMTSKLDVREDPLEQDLTEGVDSDEWEE
ncbi:coronin-7 isoform X1 [Octopus bimaculoides]|uniref:Coronin n=1 Tax=Octopus bimaculoides TaxID=37653 RepID=A0A0L8G535_OCTBM|nr:coronin-7 isoform X1 [Octopus bimaculoides]|eukprot:XP_014784002.1 PREDICTED: coronin-7-like [Octopus bimaculoides]